jgi:glutathione synthase/RimK-type ligase-like ATP-grasp enzyme
MTSERILIATCAQLPTLDPDDRALSTELQRLGFAVESAVWTDQSVNWSAARACVVRSTWDYHADPARFLRWAETVSSQTRIVNPLHVMRWNAHKFYMRDLESAGVPIVPTVWLERGTPIDLERTLGDKGWPEAVIKPAHGASADGVLLVTSKPQARADARRYLEHLLQAQDVLLQPYLATIATHHERALVFIDGVYSHAVTKSPFMHANADLAERDGLPPGSSGEPPVEPAVDELDVASAAIHASPGGATFARVDIVRDGRRPCVLEVEMVEPALYLYAKPSAAADLARAIARRVTSETSSAL